MGRDKISLKAARVNAGYTLDEAADLMGISTNKLWRWEQNPEIIPIAFKDTIQDTYHMSIDNIIFLSRN